MKINVDIDESYEDETTVTIRAKKWTQDIDALMKNIQKSHPKRVIGELEDQSVLLQPEEIEYFYAEGRKIYAVINSQKYEVHMKLYEVEEQLEASGFIRFSKSVIGNINQLSRFEASFRGTLCVYFLSGNKEYVSKKYVNVLKKALEGGNLHDI
ncbi:LytTR family DNA-binding domain-containing protein [Halalkalibacillus halophilus]|uniref:LytTR family DNA-binding domain-containing protein n=1 Tax=Halalkalibacillus halophilus TaxID=392827 RepID=UPI0003F4F130|nr:LytTR family DNA-binding domain-containing protein [Halalkalibacillus halophilus]